MKISSSTFYLAILFGPSSQAFVVNHSQRAMTRVFASNDHDSTSREISKTIATSAVAALLTSTLPFTNVARASVVPSEPFQAYTMQTSQSQSFYQTSAGSSISSSSMELSEAIKVLDMDMPSYNKISTSKTSQDDIKGVEMNNKTGKETKTPVSKEKVDKKSNTGGGYVSMPSGPTAAEKKMKAEKLKAEKAAQRLAKEQQMEEKKSEQMDYVNVEMPSYGGTESKKSVFSL